MSRSAASPRVFQLYSPRCPSPLGLPPLAPHMAFQDTPSSAFPNTPERHYIPRSAEATTTTTTTTTGHLRYASDNRRPAGGTQRCRAPPPAPLNLDSHYHPAASLHLPPTANGGGNDNNDEQAQHSHGTEGIPISKKSPTPSSSSSLSLYSGESVKKKNFSIEVIQEEREQEEEEEEEEEHPQQQAEQEESRKKGGSFCSCFAFTSLFGSTKSKQNNILAPRVPSTTTEPVPVPQMVQTRHRPPPLVIAPVER